MSPRYTTEAEKAKWAAYMREYRARQKATGQGSRTALPPTDRQLAILRAYCDPDHGGTQRAAASSLGISVSAVHNQLGRLMARLNVHSPAQAAYKLWVQPYDEEHGQEINTRRLALPGIGQRGALATLEYAKPTHRLLHSGAR